jgi:AcrR family transcriptional regulator
MGAVTLLSDDPRSPRGRILALFSERARNGVHDVVMAELARDLNMSRQTIHTHFPCKTALIEELLESWASKIEQQSAARWSSDETCVQSFKRWASEWSKGVGLYSPRFWQEVQECCPQAFARYRQRMEALRAHSHERMAFWLRPGLSSGVALELLFAAIRTAMDPSICDRHNVTRSDALDSVIEVWARGALVEPEAPINRVNTASSMRAAAPSPGALPSSTSWPNDPPRNTVSVSRPES